MKKADDKYAAWLAALSLSGPAPSTEAADEEDDFSAWAASLGEEAEKWVSRKKADADVELVPESEKRFGCVECEDGEYPVVRLFKSVEAMARYVGKAEGRDACLVMFHGSFLPMSVGPQRYLALPDGERLVTVPPGGVGPVHTISADLVDFEAQEDGFVGPPELTESAVSDKLAAEAAGHGSDGQDDDDEDDDEDY